MKKHNASPPISVLLKESDTFSNSVQNFSHFPHKTFNDMPLLIDRLTINVFSWELYGLSRKSMDLVTHRFKFKTDPMNESVSWVKRSIKLKIASHAKVKLAAYPNKHVLRITAYIQLNPTRQIRRLLSPNELSDAKTNSLDNSDNWLPHEVVCQIAGFDIESMVIRTSTIMIQQTLQCIRDMVGIENNVKERGPALSISSVEVYKDIKCNNSLLLLRAQTDRFATCFRSADTAHYQTSCTYKSIQRNGLCLSGKHRNGERLKMYAKTPTLVRLESEYSSSRIRQVIGTNVIGDNVNEWFQNLIKSLKIEFQTIFLRILPSSESSSHQYGSLLRQFYLMAKSSPSMDKFETLISILTTNGRIASNHGLYKQIYRLSKHGVLEKTERGLYRADTKLIELLGLLSENGHYNSIIDKKQGSSQ